MLNERWRRLSMLSSRCQYVARLQFVSRAETGKFRDCSEVHPGFRRRWFDIESWPEFDMFWSMPWCSFPWRKLLPRLAQKNYFTVYGLSLFHEFTSFFSTKVIYAGLPRESLPAEIGKGRHWTNVFFCGCTNNSQDWRRLSMLSSRCQYVATLQVVSRAETGKFRAFSKMHHCFRRW